MTATALLFPGQGSQEANMGRDLAETDKDIMELWKQAERISKLPLREIYWDGSEAEMANTKNLQPALTVVNLALWTHLSKNLSPAATAGHSLGEYSALAAAGVLPVTTILELVSLRGRLMSEADPQGIGAMAAILRLTEEDVAACVDLAREQTKETLVIANYNTPGQIVASGTRDAIASLQEFVKGKKGRAVVLPVSGAFHSPLMEEAAKEMAQALDAIPSNSWNNAKFPVYCNASGTAQTDATAIHALLAKQMTSSVYWTTTIRNQWDAGIRTFVECGPKGVLSRMVSPILEGYGTAKEAPEQAWNTVMVGSLEQLQEYAAQNA